MLPDLSAFPRDYETARREFRLRIPAEFNFATDVIDARRGAALLAVPANGASHEVSYELLSAWSDRIANGLAGLGLARGARVLIVTGRVPDWYAAIFACMKAGLVAMPGTPLLTPRDIAFRIGAAAAAAVIVTPEEAEKVEAAGWTGHRILAGGERPGWLSLDALAAAAPAGRPGLRTRSDELMMIYFTSGTTAKPKMVPRDHGYALAHACTALYWMDLRPGDLHWTVTDTGWAKAAWGLLFAPLLAGATVVVAEGGAGFDVGAMLGLIGRLGVTSFCAPPTVYRMAAQLDLSRFDFRSLKRALGAGEPLNPEAMRIWREATGLEIADGYGQTESVNLIANFRGVPVRPGSMGRPVPGFDVDVVDEAGARLPAGEVGHVAVRITEPWPPGLFDGYMGTGPERDRSAFRNGWYYTGDTARRDADGYFWFVGRADDLILSAGYRISPFEVESTLLEHPAVAESAVIGAPDPTRGQIVRAYVVLAAGHQPSDALAGELQDHCKRATAPYKYPREIRFVTSLPKTISGKIRRVELREGG
jgi:acetyl-CoA synthetase